MAWREADVVLTKRLFDLCESEGIAVEYGDLGTSVAGIYVRHPDLARPIIGLHSNLPQDVPLHRSVLAEEVGHHFEHDGRLYVAYYFRGRSTDEVDAAAITWAVDFLVPTHAFLDYIISRREVSKADLAEHFCVVPELIEFRVNSARHTTCDMRHARAELS